MEDIAPKLIEEVNKDFDKNVASKKIRELEEKATAGKATYDDAYKYAEEVGKARSKALLKNVTSETLPNGAMYYNIADRLMNDSLSTNHDMVTEYAAKAQEAINKKNGINLKVQTADLDQDRIDGFVNGLSGDGGNPIEEVAWKLGEPVITHARTVVDATVKKNAEFQNKAGIRATVTRKAAAKCCDWCADLDGDYTYPNVDREVFQRHDNCRCSLDYEGKKLVAYKSVSGKYNTFRDPDGTSRPPGTANSSNRGNSANRKEWHGYKSKEEYINRFSKIESAIIEKRTQGGIERRKMAEDIENTPFYAFKSLSAAARKFYIESDEPLQNTDFYIKPGTYVTGVKVIAQGDKIREVNRLINEYKLPNGDLTKAKDWYKVRGRAEITDGTKDFSREIHWYQAENIGKVEFKFPSNRKQV